MSDTERRATVSVRSLTLPTYRLCPGRQHADYSLWKGRMRVYPYSRLDRWEPEVTPVNYTALTLENEYLEAVILPELGGHVYRVLDKVTGEDLFFRNPTIKPALVAPRGAWMAGGIEFNFPAGHSLVTMSPVDWAVREEGAAASVHIGHVDRVSGMRLHVTLTLEPRIRALRQTVRMRNGTDLPQSFSYWCNAAVEARPTTRFDFPMRKVFSDEFPRELDWPLDRDVDLGLYRNNRRPSSHFSLEQWGGWFGAYQEAHDCGVYHWAVPDELPGRKAWTWGTAGDGTVWYERLSEAATPYAEIQSGLLQNQQQFSTLSPGACLPVEEWWLPISGIGRPDWVGRQGAVRLDEAAGAVRVCTVFSAKGARLEAWRQGRLVASAETDLEPASPASLPLTESGRKPDRLVVLDCAGTPLLDAELGRPARMDRLDPGRTGSDRAGGLGDRCRQAAGKEAANRWHEAEQAYTAVWEADSTSTEAAAGLSRLALRRGQWDRALRWAETASGLTGSVGRDSGEAHLLLGVCRQLAGDMAGARVALRIGLTEPRVAELARIRLVEVALAEGDLTAAEQLATSAASPALRAQVLRRLGRPEQGSTLAREALAVDPLDPVVRWEAGVWPEGVGDPDQSRLELAALLWRSGDVRAVLEAAGDEPADPILTAWRVWALRDLERESEAAAELQRLRSLPLDRAFPWRREEVRMLEILVEAAPGCGPLHALLGAFYLAAERQEDAARALEAAAVMLPPNGPGTAMVRRNLAVAYGQLGLHAAAAREAEKAVAADSFDGQLYAEADAHLEATGSVNRRRRLLEAGLSKGIDETPFLLRALAFFVAQREADRAVAVIEGHRFHLVEGQHAPRCYYVAAYLMRGRQRQQAGDRAGAAADYRRASTYPAAFGIGEPERPNHAQALYFEGEMLATQGDSGSASRCWEEAAALTKGAADESLFYGIAALRRLGAEDEATRELDRWGRTRLPEGPTSRRLYLTALQALAAGQEEEGRRLLDRADAVEAATGEDWADLLRSVAELVPEHRRPIIIRWVMP